MNFPRNFHWGNLWAYTKFPAGVFISKKSKIKCHTNEIMTELKPIHNQA